MSSEVTETGTFTTIAPADEPTNEGQSIHEHNITNGQMDAVAKMQSDGMGYQELNQFIGLFAANNSIDGMSAVVKLKHMLIEIERQGVPIRSV